MSHKIWMTLRDGKRIATLRGIVPSFYMKQVAQSMAKRIDGVGTVRNEITVSK